jgi:glycosyltransferase involved in cell wall biosynthesis
MILVNISNIWWLPGRMKRNLAMFTYLLKSSGALNSGVYINKIKVCRDRLADYFAAPEVTDIAKHRVGRKSVTVLQPVTGMPFSYRSVAVARASASLLARRIRKSFDEPYLLWINTISPLECALAEVLAEGADHVVFDSSDDMTTLEHSDPDGATQRLERTLRIADSVLCVNQHVYDLIEHPNKRIFRNCTTFETLQRTQPNFRLAPWYPKKPGATYIGFIGSITEDRIDRALLDIVFGRLPHCTFLFYGYCDNLPLAQYLRSYPNVRVLDPVPNDDLGEVIRGFDVAIVPHRDNTSTRGNDLLKVMDYFACGVPVVSTGVSDVQAYGAAVRVASNPADFANRIQELLAGTDRYDSSLAISIARERSWERQVPRLSEWLMPQQKGKRRFGRDQRETANQDQNLITPDTGPTFA